VDQEPEIPKITKEELLTALSQCDLVSTVPASRLLRRLPGAVLGGIVLSQRVAVIRPRPKSGTWVIFRGTENPGLGTWLLTNFQAASTEFRAIDPNLTHRGGARQKELPVQGAKSKIVLPGVVHQGFFRTWSQLRYGTDIPGTTFLEPSSARRLLVRYAVLAAIVAASAASVRRLGFAPRPPAAFAAGAGTLSLIAVLLTMAVESGSLERLFWRGRPSHDGVKFRDALDEPPDGRIWFVGHSLGGALATLAFAAHCNRFDKPGAPCDARLVTFASPLVGDRAFVKAFSQAHKGRFVHVAYKADPVPLTPPPPPLTLLRAGGRSLIGWWGLGLLTASALLRLYPLFWERQRPYATWERTGGLVRVGDSWNFMTLWRHTRFRYRKRLEG
jgi:hypothetical protein